MVDLAKLREPFPPDKVSWRVGSTTADKGKGMALAYIDSRDVQDRLDEVCGPGGWQSRYTHATDKKTVCEIGIKVGEEWIWKADGAGDTDVEAEKGALSDAFKRAAVRWGIGRYLYDVDSPWVALEAAGRSYKIKAEEFAKLRASLAGRPSNVAPLRAVEPPAAARATTETERARKWAEMALVKIPALKTAREFDDWHKANRQVIADVRPLDAELHAKLVTAVNVQLGKFNPVGA